MFKPPARRTENRRHHAEILALAMTGLAPYKSQFSRYLHFEVSKTVLVTRIEL